MNCPHSLREEALVLLGGQCARCGFADTRALQIDHVNGGGHEEKRRLGQQGMLRRVLKHPADYQLLCANCNWIKRAERGEAGGQPRVRPEDNAKPCCGGLRVELPVKRKPFTFKSTYWTRSG